MSDNNVRHTRNPGPQNQEISIASHDDYVKIEQAVLYLQSHYQDQPSLNELADHVHLSPYHFQRVFSRWAGLSPKKLLQLITLEQAKNILASSQKTVLDASEQVGLSSGSRLYDHFVQIEAVTPKEFKSKGQGLTLDYGYHFTPFGEVFIAVSGRGVSRLHFVTEENRTNVLNELQVQWPKALLRENFVETRSWVERIFSQEVKAGKPVHLWVKGTNFQVSIWRALLQIPSGQLTSYSRLAQAIGRPKAARAVGTAVGANEHAYIIPCHRVLRESGMLGGYRWGLSRKHVMLIKELADS